MTVVCVLNVALHHEDVQGSQGTAPLSLSHRESCLMTLLTCIPEVTGSNLSTDNDYPYWALW
jgi:hypothetical protein